MRRKITVKYNLEKFQEYENRFLKTKQFPASSPDYTNYIVPIMHTGYLMFVRSKFLFLGIKESLVQKNLYATFVLAKAYWEHIATFGYYYLQVKNFLDMQDMKAAFDLSHKMAMGGRGFVTEKMAKEKGRELKDFIIPRISSMIKIVDTDIQKKLGNQEPILESLYFSELAEGGHTTFIGLSIALRKLKNGFFLADLKKSWNKKDESGLLNLMAMASTIFFFYWDKFVTLQETYK